MTSTEKKKQVLIIDDEIQMRYYLKTLVESLKMEPILAKSGRQGLEMLKSFCPDLIILDIMMPDKGGISVYQYLAADPGLKAVPLIFFSGVDRTAFSHFLKMMNAGNNQTLDEPEHYVPKDSDPGFLMDKIRRCLADR